MENYTFTLPSTMVTTPLDFSINIVLCALTSIILMLAYVRFSRSLSGRYHIGHVIPLLALITFLVIMIVKSSIALSLGLVGALSIVRFRTPIKEPEELVVLFLAIAIGLGYGAGLPLVTSVATLVIISGYIVFGRRKTAPKPNVFNVVVEWKKPETKLGDIMEQASKKAVQIDLVKYAVNDQLHSAFFQISIENVNSIETLFENLRHIDKDITTIFSESKPIL